MTYPVVFTPEAEDQLTAPYRYVAGASSSDITADFTDAIVSYCEGLAQFPHRGTDRSDIRPGLRTSSDKKRAVIASRSWTTNSRSSASATSAVTMKRSFATPRPRIRRRPSRSHPSDAPAQRRADAVNACACCPTNRRVSHEL